MTHVAIIGRKFIEGEEVYECKAFRYIPRRRGFGQVISRIVDIRGERVWTLKDVRWYRNQLDALRGAEDEGLTEETTITLLTAPATA